MERIIVDSYVKGKKQIWTAGPAEEFNQKIVAVNEMYGWLYKEGILRDVSFEMKDYPEASYFAFNVKDLVPFRDAMELSGVKDSELAIRLIFEEEYTPCMYSGAIQLGWSMGSYRSVDGSVGRSWEVGLVQALNTQGVYEVLEARNKAGVQAAVKKTFNLLQFEPDLFEQAFQHYSEIDRSMEGYREYLYANADKLIYCFQNKFSLDLLDVDFWVQYENLLEERLSFEEYGFIDAQFDGDPHDVKDTDVQMICFFREALETYRGKSPLETMIADAAQQKNDSAKGIDVRDMGERE